MKMMLMARFTFREAFHKRVVHGVALLTVAFLVLFGLLIWLAFRELPRASSYSNEGFFHSMVGLQFTLLGMNGVSMIGALLAIFLSVGTISAEVEAGTLHAIVPKPLTRRDVLWGKWLGHAAMLAVYVFLLALVEGGLVAIFSGVWMLQVVPAALLLVLQALVLLSLSVLGTTFLPTIANGVVVFGLYSVAMMSGFMEQLGSMIRNETMVNVGIAVSLLVPSDALGKLSASLLQEGRSYLERMGPFLVTSQPSIWMVVYAVVYVGLLLVVAQAIFTRRDL
jgi:ABC-type transport system involved in multi-copper enzyme maturation permease subunit